MHQLLLVLHVINFIYLGFKWRTKRKHVTFMLPCNHPGDSGGIKRERVGGRHHFHPCFLRVSSLIRKGISRTICYGNIFTDFCLFLPYPTCPLGYLRHILYFYLSIIFESCITDISYFTQFFLV